MKNRWTLLFILAAVLGLSGTAYATLTTIGTATYGTQEYNLIYEEDNNGQALVWLDYTHGAAAWQSHVNWAAGLNTAGILDYHWNPGLSVSWDGAWRLPDAGVEPEAHSGYRPETATSEMGHLYYVSLNKPVYGPLGDTAPFANLHNTSYWSGTEAEGYLSIAAWYFDFSAGYHSRFYESADYMYALAVRPADVVFTPVPEPATMLLLGSGLVGLAGLRRRFLKK